MDREPMTMTVGSKVALCRSEAPMLAGRLSQRQSRTRGLGVSHPSRSNLCLRDRARLDRGRQGEGTRHVRAYFPLAFPTTWLQFTTSSQFVNKAEINEPARAFS